MEGFLPIFFLLVVLKIPVLGALWLIWWASKPPQTEGHSEDSSDGFGRWRPLPPRPRGPQHNGPVGALRRRRGAPLAQRRPLFRPESAPGMAAHRSGEKPSKREGHPASSSQTS